MTPESLIDFVAKLGFPVFVAVYLLLRTDRFIRENTEATKELIHLLKSTSTLAK